MSDKKYCTYTVQINRYPISHFTHIQIRPRNCIQLEKYIDAWKISNNKYSKAYVVINEQILFGTCVCVVNVNEYADKHALFNVNHRHPQLGWHELEAATGIVRFNSVQFVVCVCLYCLDDG